MTRCRNRRTARCPRAGPFEQWVRASLRQRSGCLAPAATPGRLVRSPVVFRLSTGGRLAATLNRGIPGQQRGLIALPGDAPARGGPEELCRASVSKATGSHAGCRWSLAQGRIDGCAPFLRRDDASARPGDAPKLRRLQTALTRRLPSHSGAGLTHRTAAKLPTGGFVVLAPGRRPFGPSKLAERPASAKEVPAYVARVKFALAIAIATAATAIGTITTAAPGAQTGWAVPRL